MSDQQQNHERSPQSVKKIHDLGDFELKKRLGKGGMGEVFLAHQISLDRMVALKTLSKELSQREDFVRRFLREARSMAKLDHTNVVKVYAVDSFRGIHFAAIEYIDGQSVQNWINQLGPMPVGDALHITLVCAEALKHAFGQNMIHRDIKPDNILVTKKGVVKVADFGLAKVLDEDVSMTQSGTGLGTPLYMAPEQARNAKHVDHRSDIYALGATLYHMLTGRLPFSGESTLELIIAKEKGLYRSARSHRSEVPERLDLILDRMMAKDPNHRYKTYDELIRDLSSLGQHNPVLSFIEGAEASYSGPGGAATATSAAATVATLGGTVSGRTTGGSGAAPKTSRVWYIQFEDEKGRTNFEKHTTGRVQKMIVAGILTARAKGKVSADGKYIPLAQFPEFAEQIENQLAHRVATIRKEDMGNLYAKVAKAEVNRYRWRFAKDFYRSVVGWISLIIWVAAISIIVWLGATIALPRLREIGARYGLGSGAETIEEKPNTSIQDPMDLPDLSRKRTVR